MASNMSPEEQKAIEDGRQQALAVAGQQFDALDANKDGTVEKGEMIAFAKSMAAGQAELTADQKAQADAQLDAMIGQFDTNNDGKVSREEWNNFFSSVYDAQVQQALAQQQ